MDWIDRIPVSNNLGTFIFLLTRNKHVRKCMFVTFLGLRKSKKCQENRLKFTYHFFPAGSGLGTRLGGFTVYNFPRITVAVYFTYFESIIHVVHRTTPRAGSLS